MLSHPKIRRKKAELCKIKGNIYSTPSNNLKYPLFLFTVTINLNDFFKNPVPPPPPSPPVHITDKIRGRAGIKYILLCNEYRPLWGFPKTCNKSTPQKGDVISKSQTDAIIIIIMVNNSIFSYQSLHALIAEQLLYWCILLTNRFNLHEVWTIQLSKIKGETYIVPIKELNSEKERSNK